MFCPNCGQERISQETSFCSRCGFFLTGTAELLATGGVIPGARVPGKGVSPRNRGLKQGVFIFLLTFLVVPIVAIFSASINIRPWAAALSAVSLFAGGLLRIAYALMFESAIPDGQTVEEHTAGRGLMDNTPQVPRFPPQTSIPASQYVAPGTRDTNDLQPVSVTEGTTRLLEKDEPHQ